MTTNSLAFPPGRLAGRHVKLICRTGGDLLQCAAMVESDPFLRANHPTLGEAYRKAAVGATGLDDGAALRPVATDLARVVRDSSIVGRLAATRVEMGTRVVVEGAPPPASWVTNGGPIRASAGAFSEGDELLPYLIGSITAISQEVARSKSLASDLAVANSATAGVALGLDTAFLDGTAATADRPASPFHGAFEQASTGAALDAIAADIGVALNAIAYPDLRTLTVICSPRIAARLGLLGADRIGPNGGIAFGLPFLTTRAAGDDLFLIVADQLALALPESTEIDSSEHALIELDDAPAGGAGATQTSLFAMNLVGIRARQSVSWAMRRADAAAVVRGIL